MYDPTAVLHLTEQALELSIFGVLRIIAGIVFLIAFRPRPAWRPLGIWLRVYTAVNLMNGIVLWSTVAVHLPSSWIRLAGTITYVSQGLLMVSLALMPWVQRSWNTRHPA